MLGIHWRKSAETRVIGITSIALGSLGLVAAIVLVLVLTYGDRRSRDSETDREDDRDTRTLES